jgi:hypothetical protein
MARNFRTPTLSMRGVAIDMDAMRASNEEARAVGNASMNARGDIIGPNGKIEIRREQIARDYYKNNPMAAKQVSLKPAMPDVFLTPEEAMNRITGAVAPQAETDMPSGLAPKKGRRLVDGDAD